MSSRGKARRVLRTSGGRHIFQARNSLIRDGKKEVMSVKNPNKLLWFSCGPTVYDDAHLGHARTYVSFDIVRRILASLSRINVVYAMSVTDVDDKILHRAKERNITPSALARMYEARFLEDLASLNVALPTQLLRATEHIPELIQYIAKLVEVGAAYKAPSGDVYFAVAKAGERYGQLDPSRGLTDIPEENSNSKTSGKRDLQDFALWKSVVDGDPSDTWWPSPWGPGRPGWHVECTAMATATLGHHIDIHTGGADLRFPHHTNELALAEAAQCCVSDAHSKAEHKKRWVHTWLHAGHLHISGRKMSKSVKNFTTVREYLASGGTADAFRMFCLLHRYAAPVEYSPARLMDANNLLARIRRFVTRTRADLSEQVSKFSTNEFGAMHPKCIHTNMLETEIERARRTIEEALVDDFDTPRAIAAISTLISAADKIMREEGAALSGALFLARAVASEVIAETLGTLGVTGFQEKGIQETSKDGDLVESDIVDIIVQMRAGIRHAALRKDLGQVLAMCDQTRDKLRTELNVVVSDQKDGTSSWERSVGVETGKLLDNTR